MNIETWKVRFFISVILLVLLTVTAVVVWNATVGARNRDAARMTLDAVMREAQTAISVTTTAETP